MSNNLGKNQSYARKINNELVINRLRLSPASATMLVEELNLSNSAISYILKQLELNNIIVQSHSHANYTKGRKQVYYTLNENYGIFVVLCLSNNKCKIIISNLKEEILYKEEQEIKHYDIVVFYELILMVKNLLAERYSNYPLLGVYIAVPGKVNSTTGELQLSKQFDKSLFVENNKINDVFKKHFNAPIYIQNDTNLAIIGEKNAGALVDSNDAMLVYVDNGVGASMILNGHYYTGSCGYAGELGLMQATFKGEKNYLDEFISMRSIKNYVFKKYGKTLVSKEVAELYYQEKELHDHVIETAHLLGQKLKDVLEILNISKMVIQGRVSLFGDDYLNAVIEEVNKSQNQCEVCFSKLNGDSIFIGAVAEAVEHLIDDITHKLMIEGGQNNE